MVNKYAVLGSPISHSLSPVIHRVAYDFLGLDWTYESFDVKPDSFAEFLNKLPTDFLGLSVTMPLKELAFANSISHDVESLRSNLSNTLLRGVEGWSSFNTDVFGMSMALRPIDPISLRNVLIIGTGATAKSTLMALANIRPNTAIQILGRKSTAVDELIGFSSVLGLSAIAFDRLTISDFDLVISTVPANAFTTFKADLDLIKAFGVLMDVSYNPWPSAAAKYLQGRGFSAISGINMLVWQAIGQLRIFLNGTMFISLKNEDDLSRVMLRAAETALG